MKLSFNSNALKTLRVYKKNISEHSKSINNISKEKFVDTKLQVEIRKILLAWYNLLIA